MNQEQILKIEAVENIPFGKWYEGDGFEITTNRQIIRLLIDNGQGYFADWGFFLSEEDPQLFIGAKLLNITKTDTALKTEDVNPNYKSATGGDTLFVNLETSKGTLQFVAYNSHNGYYGHSACVISEQLNIREVL